MSLNFINRVFFVEEGLFLKRLIIGAMILFMLLGCEFVENPSDSVDEDESIENHSDTEMLDLSLVGKYEFTVFSYDDYSEDIIHVEKPEDIKKINEFLGETVMITHYKDPCNCAYPDFVRIFLVDGKELFFGIEKNSAGSFNFSKNSLSVISFEDNTLDGLISLVKALGKVK